MEGLQYLDLFNFISVTQGARMAQSVSARFDPTILSLFRHFFPFCVTKVAFKYPLNGAPMVGGGGGGVK